MIVFRNRAGNVRAFLCTAVAAALVVVASPVAVAGTAPETDEVSCRGVDVPLRGGDWIHGQFCQPEGGRDAVQILVPGVTYDHRYWDFEHRPETYSYRRAANAAGFSTFAADRLGTGGSSRPVSAALTAFSQADAVHRVITALRDGTATGTRFGSVLLGGHSLGSTIAIIEAATYRDVDGVLLTGVGHRFDAVQLGGLFASMHPAAADPVLASHYPATDPGYLTTRPGTRARFLHPPDVDPAVLAADEQTKSVFSSTEAPDAALLALVSPYSRRIDVPVFLVNGADDVIFCPVGTDTCTDAGSLAAAESHDYGSAACLRTAVLPGTGHDVNLSRSAPEFQRAALQWAGQVVGGERAPGGCPPGSV